MRKFLNYTLAIFLMGAFVTVGCNQFEDDINKLKDDVAALQESLTDVQSKIDDGAVITDVTPTADGLKITLSDGSSYDVKNGANGAKGDKGDKGDTGAQGEAGATGAQGEAGTPGSVVTIGENGNWFIDGVDTELAAQGEQGEQGEQGQQGNYFIPGPAADYHWLEVTVAPDGTKDTVDTEVQWLPEDVLTAIVDENGFVTLFNVMDADGNYGEVVLGNVVIRSISPLPKYWNDNEDVAAVRFYTLFDAPLPLFQTSLYGQDKGQDYQLYNTAAVQSYITSNVPMVKWRVNPQNADVKDVTWEYASLSLTKGACEEIVSIEGDVVAKDGYVEIPTLLHAHNLSDAHRYVDMDVIDAIADFENMESIDMIYLNATDAQGNVVSSNATDLTVQHDPLWPRFIFNPLHESSKVVINDTEEWEDSFDDLPVFDITLDLNPAYYDKASMPTSNGEEILDSDEATNQNNPANLILPYDEGTIDLNKYVETITGRESQMIKAGLNELVEMGLGMTPLTPEDAASLAQALVDGSVDADLLRNLGFDVKYKFEELANFYVKDHKSGAVTDQQWFIEEGAEGVFNLVPKYTTSAKDRTPIVKVDAVVTSCCGTEAVVASAFIKLVITDAPDPVTYSDFTYVVDPFTVTYSSKNEANGLPRYDTTPYLRNPFLDLGFDTKRQKHTDSEDININLYGAPEISLSNDEFVSQYGTVAMDNLAYISGNDPADLTRKHTCTYFYFCDEKGKKLTNSEIMEGVTASYREIVVDGINTIQVGIFVDPETIDFDGCHNVKADGTHDEVSDDYTVYVKVDHINGKQGVIFKFDFTVNHRNSFMMNESFLVKEDSEYYVAGAVEPVVLAKGDNRRNNNAWELYTEAVEHFDNYLGRSETGYVADSTSEFPFIYNMESEGAIQGYYFEEATPGTISKVLRSSLLRFADRTWDVVTDVRTAGSITDFQEALVNPLTGTTRKTIVDDVYNTDIELVKEFVQTQKWDDIASATDKLEMGAFIQDDDVKFVNTFVNAKNLLDWRGDYTKYTVRFLNPFYISGPTTAVLKDKVGDDKLDLKPLVWLRLTEDDQLVSKGHVTENGVAKDTYFMDYVEVMDAGHPSNLSTRNTDYTVEYVLEKTGNKNIDNNLVLDSATGVLTWKTSATALTVPQEAVVKAIITVVADPTKGTAYPGNNQLIGTYTKNITVTIGKFEGAI